MVFHSTAFLWFFLPVFAVYWRLTPPSQNRWLLLASYLFYGLWDWRFVPLLAFSSWITYLLGNAVHRAEPSQKFRRMLAGVLFNLSLLGVFKYFNFFMENFFRLYHFTGGQGNPPLLALLMPLGISFYTFKAVSYGIDIYRGAIQPAKSFSDFALYMAFFPQLIAGPIDRPSSLIPQIEAPRTFIRESFFQGCFLIGWGLFQKLFIADNLASIVNPVFASRGPYDPSSVLLILYVYAFQLYHDFAGYSHMAWGIAKVLGFETTHNFNLPFLAPNIQSFWNRWHISLSLWIREYLYTPVFIAAGNLPTAARLYLATLTAMTAIGLWHGAAWHYVLYGVYHGILLCLYTGIRPWLQKTIHPEKGVTAALWQGIRIFFVFHLVAVGFLMFRAESCGQFFEMMGALISGFPRYSFGFRDWFPFIFFIWTAILVEWFQFKKNDRWAVFQWNPAARAAFYVICIYLLCLHGAQGEKEFIYFQF